MAACSGPDDPAGWAAYLREEARALGFEGVAITRPNPSPASREALKRWLAEGYHGTMEYMAAPGPRAAREDPSLLLPGVRSVVIVRDRYPHASPEPLQSDPRRAVIARYARGSDYHRVIAERLHLLLERIGTRSGGAVGGRVAVDTLPFLERDAAQRAGLGWIGRNTLLIDPRAGSWTLLGVLLLDVELPADPPFERDHCGRCTRCMDACPTGALLGRDASGAPVLDARRCISYLTIESKGPIPPDLRPAIGNRVFGCDICQEVCPWNGPRKAPEWPTPQAAYAPRPELDLPSLIDLTRQVLRMSGKGYQRAFRDSPLARPRRAGMLRNLLVGLGNSGDPDALAVLEEAAGDPSPMVREHAEWALARIRGPATS